VEDLMCEDLTCVVDLMCVTGGRLDVKI